MADGPAVRTLSKSEALALTYPKEMAARAGKLRDVLQSSRSPAFTLARGNPQSLTRTYNARLAQAQVRGVPTVGIQALLDQLLSYPGEHVWGFTVSDNAMVYMGFADQELSSLVGVVIIARYAADSILLA